MLETKLLAFQIQPLYTGRPPKPNLHRLCDQNEPIDSGVLKDGGNYFVNKNIIRNGEFWGNIYASATEISHYTSIIFPLNLTSTEAVRLLLDAYDELQSSYNVIRNEELQQTLDKYWCPFIPQSSEKKAFQEKLELVGDPAIFASTKEDSWDLNDVYDYDGFLERLGDTGFVSNLQEMVLYMDDFGKMSFWLDGGACHAQVISPVDYTPLLPMLLSGTCLDDSEIRQVIGFVNKLYNREGFFLGMLEEK